MAELKKTIWLLVLSAPLLVGTNFLAAFVNPKPNETLILFPEKDTSKQTQKETSCWRDYSITFYRQERRP